MEVIEALRTSIPEPHDHLHINQIRAFFGAGLSCIVGKFGEPIAMRRAGIAV